MNISFRLENIASMVEKCDSMVDVGTDHGYIPIYLVKNKVCNRAVASDINRGPVEKAKNNVILENLQDKISCRLGGGLTTVKPHEVNCAVIAGMGGNLIRDILEESLDVFKNLDYAILQPMQNAEVLRKYIYLSGYKIIDEGLCIDENKFYEIIKVKYENKPKKIDNIYYEISERLIDNKHPLVGEFIQCKLNKYNKIYKAINEDTELAEKRKKELLYKISRLKELL